MPTVGVNRDKLFEKLGKVYTDEEFDHLCFEYGIELDDVTSEKEMLRKELASAMAKGGDNKLAAEAAAASEEVIYKIDIPANRYDMLCVEGIARALNIFRGTQAAPEYRLADMSGKPLQQMTVKPETSLVRPFVVCAVLRGVAFDAARYNSFIDLQDKLHQNLCRQRTLVAIGTHDLAKIQGPFTYEALPPEDIRFVPLKQTREFNAKELMQYYLDNDQKLKKFVPIIHSSVVYPVIYDANRTVLSLPPIINGQHSAISLETKDVFIECTATDLTKAKVVLNTVVTMFSEYCSRPFEVEPVEVTDAFGNKTVYPDLSCRRLDLTTTYVNSLLGVSLPGPDIATLLNKMQVSATLGPDGTALSVSVPPTRSDILHACDVAEDVAIAHGYNNIATRIPPTATQGRELPLNQVTELLRSELAMAGFTEVLTWALVSRAENFDQLRRPDDGATAVEIGNPATAEFEVCRSSLLSSALKTLGANKENALPIKLFEVSDAILLDSAVAVGARNERRLVAVYCAKESGFEVVHGLLNRVMEVLGVPYRDEPGASSAPVSYHWAPAADPALFPGRQAAVFASTCGDKPVGVFGIVHPEVLTAFELPYPVSALELNIEPFVFDQFYQSKLEPLSN
ncbi:hypothetical protein CHLRE_13g603900v5 [Chlamydomonas reinhardtii]|uniref:phenylalanine--tRNA ligase n=1 Tax=Chlamydomonas reinhardtii TaxID=3055 RepID=A0A2K3D1B0_CHLRE|nr:uncharacterized protein CHLRE_13g603900v5 [Chlamydomonas reinhardtii]PNW74324.1 hypothetical protein CHLRE_13g603900v5 [Chlamydomonas reinhardtii]